MNPDIVIENKHFRLLLGADCCPKSLLHKASGQECLDISEDIPLFSVTQPRPFNNEVKLAYPNKRTTFQADRLRREGNRLIVGFEIIPYEAVVEVRETDAYVSFKLADFIVKPEDYQDLHISPPPAESFRLLQLPVKHRKSFGQWLNVCWDDDVAVNVLATSPTPIIDSEKRKHFRILTADAQRDVQLQGCEAALIVTESKELLDAIDRLEQDYNLPRGVQSRRNPALRKSPYLASGLSPKNVDKHIAYCKKCGYTMMTLYYESLFKGRMYDSCGNYDEQDIRESYPEGFESLKQMLQKIKAAGITPGLHFLHTHIGLKSRYVTPVADHRLHKTKIFTLARPLSKDDTTVYVDQDPTGAVMSERCRILQFGGELIHYEGYTTQRPYCFTGCKRGDWDTIVTEHPQGQMGGILDVSEYAANSCYIDQETDLQDEIAKKLAKVFDTGFEYIYFDGSEGTNAPYGYHVSNAQYRVLKQLKSAPAFAEGAAKTHFGWHFLSGANAFDISPPHLFKEMIRRHPAQEALQMRQDFTRVNFGWWHVYTEEDGGVQPDHWEYGSALAAAFDCPATLSGVDIYLDVHPRADDLLEVLRRWEDVRTSNWLNEAQKKQIIDNQQQEHILLINEQKDYELVPYTQIPTADDRLRAFGFCRNGRSYVVYWHTKGEGTLTLPAAITLQDELYEPAKETTVLPVGRRRYASSEIPLEQLTELFQTAKLS